MSRKYTKIDQYEKQILSILIVRAKPEQKVYLQRLRKIFLQLFTFAHPVVFVDRSIIRGRKKMYMCHSQFYQVIDTGQ